MRLPAPPFSVPSPPHLHRPRWCNKNGATSLADLDEASYEGRDFVIEFANALEPLSAIVKGKLINAIRREIKKLKTKSEL